MEPTLISALICAAFAGCKQTLARRIRSMPEIEHNLLALAEEKIRSLHRFHHRARSAAGLKRQVVRPRFTKSIQINIQGG